MSENYYHQAVLRNAGEFEIDSFKKKRLPVHDVEEISGKLKDEGHNRIRADEVQSYRFPADKFSASSAKQWLKANKIAYKSFEEAKDDTGVTKTIKTSASAGDISIAKGIFGKEARRISAYEDAIVRTSNQELKVVLSNILAEKKVTAEQVLRWYAKA